MDSFAEHAVIAGKYRLVRALARGGMGSVWVARHLALDIEVAIKFMVPEYAVLDEARGRFEHEARVSAQLKSPYVVHTYDYGSEEGMLFLVMELLQGEDLYTRLLRNRRLTPASLASVVTQVCKGLECAHEAGLVHRDLKPANIFLARQGKEEIAKVLDFGLAKFTDPSVTPTHTKTGMLVGSPYYMSPEQVRKSREVDTRSDLWALGVILFECLTGRVPFMGNEVGDVLVAICSDPIPLASQIARDLGPQVDQFFMRALSRNLNRRFQTAGELAEAFAALAQPAAPKSDGIYGKLTVALRGPKSDPLPVRGSKAPASPADSDAVTLERPPGMEGPDARLSPQYRRSLGSESTLAASSASVSARLQQSRKTSVLVGALGGLCIAGLAAAFLFGGRTEPTESEMQRDHVSASTNTMPTSVTVPPALASASAEAVSPAPSSAAAAPSTATAPKASAPERQPRSVVSAPPFKKPAGSGKTTVPHDPLDSR